VNDFDTTSIYEEEQIGGLKGLYWLIPFLTVNRGICHISSRSLWLKLCLRCTSGKLDE
jgi:hypothetical protein